MSFFRMICVLAFGLGFGESLNAEEKRPNVIFFLADDLGWKDVGFHGSEIKTPNLDALAKGGTELTSYYVQPVCSPTRGALLSGKYPCRLGLQCGVVRPWAKHGLPLNEKTLADVFADAGYFTAICGKWHLGHSSADYLPMARGFAHQYGHYNGALDYFTHRREGGLDWHRNQQGLEEEGYTTTLMGQESVRVIESHDFERPLFLYVPFNAPHSPLQAPKKYLSQYEHIKAKKRRAFAAMVTCLDDAVGAVVQAIKDRKQTDNTLIIFCSDNGGPENLGANNGELRAGKGTLYEGGVRVPAVIHWPGVIPANQRTDGIMHIVDWLPTLAAALELGNVPENLDGLNQWPMLTGKTDRIRTEVLFNTTPFHGAIRVGDWKLIHNGHISANAVSAKEADRWELFNLADDRGEEKNLFEANPEMATRLKKRLEYFANKAVAPNIPPNKMPADFIVPKIW